MINPTIENINIVKLDKEHFLNNIGKINAEMKNQFKKGFTFLFLFEIHIDGVEDTILSFYSKQNTDIDGIKRQSLKMLNKYNGILFGNIMEYNLSTFDLLNYKPKPKVIMTQKHPRWNEFCEMLIAKDGCNFTKLENGEYTWTCDNTFKFSKILLEYMKDFSIKKSIEYFEENGAYCDCEVLFNIDFKKQLY